MKSEDVGTQTRWDRKKEATRAKIIDIAIELFEKKGLDQTSMEQIAEEADVAKGTLYNYFPNKSAIISAYARNNVQNYDPVWQKIIDENPDTHTRLLSLIKFCYEWILQNKDSFKVYIISGMQERASLKSDMKSHSGMQRVYERIFLRGQEEGEIRQDIDAGALAALFNSNLAIVIIAWLTQGDSFPALQTLKNTIDLFLNGSLKR